MADRMYVATRKGLFTVDRAAGGASDWRIARTAFLGDNVTLAVHDARSGCVFAALDHGHFGIKLHRSSDDGAGWEECSTPAYPARDKDAEPDIDPMSKTPIAWSTKLIWSLAPGGADIAGEMWCGTIPGGLFRSEDGGKSWHLNRPLWDHPDRKEWFGGGMDLPGIHSICVDPRDPNHVTVGVSCGGVWVTTDRGASWNCRAEGMWAAYMPPDRKHDPRIQDPHMVAQCASAPEALWVQHHNGVFRSTDGAASWQECKDIKPSTFGFAVAVHPAEPRTAWFVPGISDERRIPVDGKVVVTRTRDGGESFDILDKGLPGEHAYDITFRHALDVDESGDTLAFGTTTGSLFVTADQGDSWHCVSAHLPPVYSVRFVK